MLMAPVGPVYACELVGVVMGSWNYQTLRDVFTARQTACRLEPPSRDLRCGASCVLQLRSVRISAAFSVFNDPLLSSVLGALLMPSHRLIGSCAPFLDVVEVRSAARHVCQASQHRPLVSVFLAGVSALPICDVACSAWRVWRWWHNITFISVAAARAAARSFTAAPAVDRIHQAP